VSSALASPSSASALWFLTRGTGTVALLLLTAVLVLGILARGSQPLPACPRFVTPALHRNLALLAVALLSVHILTAVADPFAPIRLADAVVPFRSAYRPVWVGLGALALDVLIALVVTSLLRARIGRRVWKAVHWAAYASWPIAIVHGLGTGTDVKTTWLLGVTVLCTLSVLVAVLWRILGVGGATPGRRSAAVALTIAMPLALAVFVVAGPLAPHWAARAGTPPALLSGAATTTGSTQPVAAIPPAPIPRGAGTISGRAHVRTSATRARVVIAARVGGGLGGRLRIVLNGLPDVGQGITLSDGTVSYSQHSVTYSGPVTALEGGQIDATLSGPSGHLQMLAQLSIASSQVFTGTVTMS
jgi:sulfoxide reductase heme-binding subunit YedZ